MKQTEQQGMTKQTLAHSHNYQKKPNMAQKKRQTVQAKQKRKCQTKACQ